MRWTTTLLGHRINYTDTITPDGDDRCLVTMTAEVSGVVGSPGRHGRRPDLRFGQRRRLARLGMLAEYLHRRAIVFAA